MANICYNEFLFTCPREEFETWRNKFNKLEFGYLDISYEDEEGVIEGSFESRWTFPMHIFDSFIPNGLSEIYFRCLSNEPGCEYFACNIYKNGEWWMEQCFEV